MFEGKNIDAEFRRQLEEWIKASGRQKAAIAELTRYLDFGDGPIQMAATTLAKSIKKPPTRREGKYNLYAILGVLYMLEVIQETDIDHFLEHYSVGDVPDGRVWQDIWRAIEQGAVQRRAHLQTEPVKNDDYPKTQTRISKKLAVAVMLTLAGLLAGFLLVILIRPNPNPYGISNACLEPVSGTPPEFIHEQGFSLYSATPGSERGTVLSNSIRSVGIDANGIWVGYAPGANGIDGTSHFVKGDGQWIHCPGLLLSEGQNINDFAFIGDARYLAVDGVGVARLSSNGWDRYTIDYGLPSNSAYSFFIDDENALWVVTDGGVAKVVGERWVATYTARPEELVSSHVYGVYDDKAGNRWFGLVNRGISRLSGSGEWTSYYTSETGLQNVRGITGDDKGGVWFATDGGGLARFYNNGWKIYSQTQGNLLSDHVWDVERDMYDRIWAATDRGVLYTSDYGQTWITHSTWETLDIEFGCPGCAYDEIHMWLVLKDRGLGHVRIPPNALTIRIVSAPGRVRLKPGEEYVFEVEVQALSEPFTKSDGLFSTKLSELYGAWHTIPVQGNVERGETYTFSNIETPIKAPDKPGVYTTEWRVWQGGRFVTDPLIIEFEVIDDGSN